MADYVKNLFDASDFVPRRFCGNWSEELVGLHIGSDVLIWLAYLTIPVVLVYFIRRRRDMPFSGVFWIFGLFIASCGFTHFMEAIAFCWPAYRLMGAIKLIAAAASWATVVLLVPVIPRALSLRSAEEFRDEGERHRRAQARLRALLDSAPDALVVVDHEGRIKLVNSQTETLFGYARDDLIGQPIELLVPARFRVAHAAHRADYFAKPRARPIGEGHELWGVRKDGTEFPVEISLSPVATKDGLFVSSAVRDITERKRIEKTSLRQARLLDVTHDSIMVTDMDDTIIYWNHGSELRYGWTQDQALGRNAYTLLETAFSEPLGDIMAKLVRDEQWEGELVHSRRDGSRIVVASRWVLQRDEHGQVMSIMKTNNDITERKHIERALQERTVQLEAVNKELEAFSYSVSHDLRAPLRAIDGFSRMLLEDCAAELSDAGKSYLQTVRDCARQMGCLIDELLAFARFGRQPITKQAVDMAALVQQCLSSLSGERIGRHIQVEIGALPPCSGDPGLLKQVWTNLLSNAIKYTRSREVATIEIGCQCSSEETSELTYFVKDNGVGFDMRYADRLFNVFQRLHRTEDYEGNGVGLAIVERIIRRHGGRVWAAAEPEAGATFFFTLERVRERV
jgi:PAS domain S-box-containing protein